MIPTTINPKTASLFFSRRRHASRHNDVPRTNSSPSTGRTSASATAISGEIWINSSCSGLFSVDIASKSSLCNLCVLCVSVVSFDLLEDHHRGTENTEIAQRNPNQFSVIPHPRIDKRVGDINQQIHQQECYRNKCDDADEQRFVTVKCSLNKIISQTRQCEDPFDHYSSC